jgi:sugar/nucleoside kinase (ribokinase family)
MSFLKNPGRRVVGIGSALIDVLAQVTDDFLTGVSDVKGGMTLVENDFIHHVTRRLAGTPDIVPGGATCNTMIGIGKLGGDSSFVGQCGDDDMGRLFEEGLIASGVKPRLFKSSTPTGRVLSLITPDAQRSMFTYLGASAEMDPDAIMAEFFHDAAVVMIEGYLVFNRTLMMAALAAAKKANASIALDLASFTVVESSRDFIMENVVDHVDILIANEDEARAFSGVSDEDEALSILSTFADTAVLKLGKRGSLIAQNGDIVRVDPLTGKDAVDTTGAGDLWAAGFLYGITHGYSLDEAGAIGSACGYEVCQVTGASIPDHGWDRIRTLL